MSLRRRIPFTFSSENDQDERILDEEEQDEVIEQLKERSKKQNSRYQLFLQVVVGLSMLLHIIYLNKQPPRYSPLDALFPSESYIPSLPLSFPFALLHIFVHLILIIRLFPAWSPVYAAVVSSFPSILSYRVIFGISSIAPVLSLLCRGDWRDIAWWSMADALALLVRSTQKWAAEEAENILQLENMRYAAKGA